MKKGIIFLFIFKCLNGQMSTGNDIFTALNSVNDTEKNYAKYFITGYVTGHKNALDSFNPYNKFEERKPNDVKYNKMLESQIKSLKLYPEQLMIGWDMVFEIIDRYLRLHPDERHENIDILIRKAMNEVYLLEEKIDVKK
ncbi:MAG: hypothetical protein CMG62_07050 [Candidatus Marinimicrobia bacterium]|nr:hypothetical protein [Candidatus Neomarinimicrobiota bacterium]